MRAAVGVRSSETAKYGTESVFFDVDAIPFGVDFRAHIAGMVEQCDTMLVVIGNGISYGGGMRVLPDARLNDGVLDVCVVTAMGKGAFLRSFPKVFRGSHVSHPNVVMLRGRGVKAEADRRVDVYADGERVGPLPAVFEIVPGALARGQRPGVR